jgi:hypothetical protein
MKETCWGDVHTKIGTADEKKGGYEGEASPNSRVLIHSDVYCQQLLASSPVVGCLKSTDRLGEHALVVLLHGHTSRSTKAALKPLHHDGTAFGAVSKGM